MLVALQAFRAGLADGIYDPDAPAMHIPAFDRGHAIGCRATRVKSKVGTRVRSRGV